MDKKSKKKKDMVLISIDNLKHIYIEMVNKAVSGDKDCSRYILDEAINDLVVKFDRVNFLVQCSIERQGNKPIKAKKKKKK